jgi:hypothetical protein
MADPRGDPFGVPLQAPLPRFLQNALTTFGLAPAEPAAPAPGPGAMVVASGVGLPPPESPFWQRPDVAEKVLQAVGAIETERSSLATQVNESLHAERGLTKEVTDLKVRHARVAAGAAAWRRRHAARRNSRRLQQQP